LIVSILESASGSVVVEGYEFATCRLYSVELSLEDLRSASLVGSEERSMSEEGCNMLLAVLQMEGGALELKPGAEIDRLMSEARERGVAAEMIQSQVRRRTKTNPLISNHNSNDGMALIDAYAREYELQVGAARGAAAEPRLRLKSGSQIARRSDGSTVYLIVSILESASGSVVVEGYEFATCRLYSVELSLEELRSASLVGSEERSMSEEGCNMLLAVLQVEGGALELKPGAEIDRLMSEARERGVAAEMIQSQVRRRTAWENKSSNCFSLPSAVDDSSIKKHVSSSITFVKYDDGQAGGDQNRGTLQMRKQALYAKQVDAKVHRIYAKIMQAAAKARAQPDTSLPSPAVLASSSSAGALEGASDSLLPPSHLIPAAMTRWVVEQVSEADVLLQRWLERGDLAKHDYDRLLLDLGDLLPPCDAFEGGYSDSTDARTSIAAASAVAQTLAKGGTFGGKITARIAQAKAEAEAGEAERARREEQEQEMMESVLAAEHDELDAVKGRRDARLAREKALLKKRAFQVAKLSTKLSVLAGEASANDDDSDDERSESDEDEAGHADTFDEAAITAMKKQASGRLSRDAERKNRGRGVRLTFVGAAVAGAKVMGGEDGGEDADMNSEHGGILNRGRLRKELTDKKATMKRRWRGVLDKKKLERDNAVIERERQLYRFASLACAAAAKISHSAVEAVEYALALLDYNETIMVAVVGDFRFISIPMPEGDGPPAQSSDVKHGFGGGRNFRGLGAAGKSRRTVFGLGLSEEAEKEAEKKKAKKPKKKESKKKKEQQQDDDDYAQRSLRERRASLRVATVLQRKGSMQAIGALASDQLQRQQQLRKPLTQERKGRYFVKVFAELPPSYLLVEVARTTMTADEGWWVKLPNGEWGVELAWTPPSALGYMKVAGRGSRTNHGRKNKTNREWQRANLVFELHEEEVGRALKGGVISTRSLGQVKIALKELNTNAVTNPAAGKTTSSDEYVSMAASSTTKRRANLEGSALGLRRADGDPTACGNMSVSLTVEGMRWRRRVNGEAEYDEDEEGIDGEKDAEEGEDTYDETEGGDTFKLIDDHPINKALKMELPASRATERQMRLSRIPNLPHLPQQVHQDRFVGQESLSKALDAMCKYMDVRHVRSKDVFRLADHSSDGTLDFKELLWLLQKVGITDADESLVKLFSGNADRLFQDNKGHASLRHIELDEGDDEGAHSRRNSASSNGSNDSDSSGYSSYSDSEDETKRKKKKRKSKKKSKKNKRTGFNFDELENMIRLYRRGLLHHDMDPNANANGNGDDAEKIPSPPRTPTPEGLRFLGAEHRGGGCMYDECVCMLSIRYVRIHAYNVRPISHNQLKSHTTTSSSTTTTTDIKTTDNHKN
jgi:hypothetical protein